MRITRATEARRSYLLGREVGVCGVGEICEEGVEVADALLACCYGHGGRLDWWWLMERCEYESFKYKVDPGHRSILKQSIQIYTRRCGEL